jgi:hypothetical protein
MNYLESYRFIFRSPKWLTNLLICAVAILVPIAGPMVLFGYQFDILEALHLRGRETYPDFDFNRLGKYLIRGAWPFLVQLVMGLILGIVPGILVGTCYLGFLLNMLTQGPGGGPPVPSPSAPLWGALLGTSFLFAVLVGILGQVLLIPMTLRAGLMQDFAAGFSWPFLRDFMGRMWGKTILAELFLIVTAFPLEILGMLLCFVGLYPAVAWIALARGYLMFELYEEYLKHGGMEIPLRVETPPPLVPDDEG